MKNREIEEYKRLWETLKKALKNWSKETDEDKLVNEKVLYLDLIQYMKILEKSDNNENQ